MAKETSKTTADGESKVLDLSHLDDATFKAVQHSYQERAIPVVGNFADLQRLGAHVLGDTTTSGAAAAAVAVPPGLSDEEAKAGANRVIKEEAEAKAASADFETQRSDPGHVEKPAKGDKK